MTIEIVDLPMNNGGSFYSYVKLPEDQSDQRLDVSMESSRHGIGGTSTRTFKGPMSQGSDGVRNIKPVAASILRSLHTFRIDPKVAQDDSAPKFKRL